MTWRVVQLVLMGGHALMERTDAIHYWSDQGVVTDPRKAWIGHEQEAKDRADALNAAGRLITPAEFETRVAGVPMKAGTREALRLIMVEGKTWKAAAEAGGLTESGIKRAFDRMKGR